MQQLRSSGRVHFIMMPMLMLLKMGSWAKGWCGGKSG